MAMHIWYDNKKDAEMRLNNTYIRYKGKPAYVLGFTAEGRRVKIHLEVGIDRNEVVIDWASPDIDISSPPLGYINLHSMNKGNEALYAARMPSRRQAQGLIPDKIVYMECGKTGTWRHRNPIRDAIMRVISNDYRDAVGCYEHWFEERKDGFTVAFSREWAVGERGVYWRAHCVGQVKHESGKHIITLDKTLFYDTDIKEVFADDNWRVA